MTENRHEIALKLTPEAFAVLGGGEIAYVKPVRSEDVKTLFPQAPQLAPGMQFFALHAADGTPIMLTDSREAAIASAREQALDTVSFAAFAESSWIICFLLPTFNEGKIALGARRSLSGMSSNPYRVLEPPHRAIG